MYSLTKFLLICFFLVGIEIIQAQTISLNESKKKLEFDGSEKSNNQNPKVISVNSTNYSSPEFGDVFTYNFHNITDIKTGYDYQSNGSTQEVWYDLNNDLLHSIFTNSQDSIPPWADRTTKYFFSTDLGVTWMELGNVPNDGSRSGFPAISGLSTGAVVLTNHSNTGGGSTRSQIFIDSGPGEFNLTTYDPGVPVPGGPSTIWPGITSTLNDNVVLVSSMNAFPKFAATNTLYLPVGTFSGWSEYRGGNAETYSLSISENGKIGHAFIGGDESDEGDIFYRESVNNGITWSTPLKIFDATPEISDTGYGALRGVSCNFYGENPAVVWEDALRIYSFNNFFPEISNHIWFWSPNVNSGRAIVLADSNNVPFAPSLGTLDFHAPVCRPVIGRSESGGCLFVAFDVATLDVFPSADSTTYFAGYFMYSSDGGQNWSTPEKFTPDEPLRDWRYISIAPVNPVVGEFCNVHIVLQGDPIPGSTVNAAGMPVGVTAQYYHVSIAPLIIPVEVISFNAELQNKNVVLKWVTATETNNQGFEIQRRTDEVKYEKVGFVPGYGTTTEIQIYSFMDYEVANGSYTYRLKQIDFDGTIDYSDEVFIDVTAPIDFSLSQNYPNPFNPSTKIKYSIPSNVKRETSNVSLIVYDVLGSEIATLVNEEKPIGNYEVNFDGTGLPSGVYFYKLQAGSFVETKKMVLLR